MVTPTDLSALRERAQAGDAEAQYQLGVRLMTARGAPFLPRDGVRVLDAAVAQNHAAALRLAAVLSTVGYERPLDWGQALALLAQGCDLCDAEALAARLTLGDGFDIAAFAAPPPSREIFERPRIAVIENFLPPAFCDWIIGRAMPALEAAKVYDPLQGGKRPGERRTNTGTGFGLVDSDLVLQAVNARIAAAIDLPLVQQEATNVLHYEPGQEFLPHFDSLDPAVPHFASDLALNGQRLLTFLIYLNDEFEGGETDFPRLDWRFKGAKGDAILFWNVGPDGAPDQNALHAGLAPTSGEKWLLSKWVRSKALPLI